jgi:hypothetical protein
MTIRFAALAILLAAVVCATGSPGSSPVVPPAATSVQVIPYWYAIARTAPATPVQLSRVLAMVHAAMHDAVNGTEPRYETYVSDLTDSRAHHGVAAASAAHRVLSGLFPALQATWDAALAESLSTIPGGRSEQFGLKLGAAVGQLVLEVRAHDGWNSADPFDPAPAPGIWRPTPPAFSPMAEPQFQNVTPFTIESHAPTVLRERPTRRISPISGLSRPMTPGAGSPASFRRTKGTTSIGRLGSTRLSTWSWPTDLLRVGTGNGSTFSGDRSPQFGKGVSTAIPPRSRIPPGNRFAVPRLIRIIRRLTVSLEAPRPKSYVVLCDRIVTDSA